MAYSVFTIADYFIWRANADDEIGENITNLKLQKLVYYAQGFSLVLSGGPLFDEPIVAWVHGPVVPVLYSNYREHGGKPIPTRDGFDPAMIDSETRDLLEEVYDVYGQYSAWGLRNLTHEEAPWQNTPLNEVISLEKMRAFFVTQIADD